MKNFLKKNIPKESSLFKILAYFNSFFVKKEDFYVLREYLKTKTHVFFVQIGSNDGKQDDPLYNYITKQKWEGILVEPVPYLFEKLKLTYKNYPHLHFENSAIAKENGSSTFYRLKQSDLPNLPQWYDKIGSFNKDVVLKSRDYIPNFDDLLIEDTVQTISFRSLIEKYTINKINILHIDTEGYDFEILKMIPFNELNIDLILFEHKHLTAKDYDLAIKLLKSFKYKITKFENDTFALKQLN